MTERIVAETLDEYFALIRKHTCLHGRDALQAYQDTSTLELGFSTPTAVIVHRLSTLKGYFSGPWREDHNLIKLYTELGGKTPLIAFTHQLPDEIIVPLYRRLCTDAIAAGEKDRAASRPA